MKDSEISFNGFLKCFKEINFLITKNPKKQKQRQEKMPDSVSDSIYHLNKMLARAKKDLSRAIKEHKAGKTSIEDVMDHEYHVHEISEEIRKIQEINNDLDEELS